MTYQSQYTKDNWHREAEDINVRNNIRARRWGMRVTVYDDPTPSNNGEWVLTYGEANTNRQSNANWLKVADIGALWGGGGGSNTAGNGLSLVGSEIRLGGSSLDADTLVGGGGHQLVFGFPGDEVAGFGIFSSASVNTFFKEGNVGGAQFIKGSNNIVSFFSDTDSVNYGAFFNFDGQSRTVIGYDYNSPGISGFSFTSQLQFDPAIPAFRVDLDGRTWIAPTGIPMDTGTLLWSSPDIPGAISGLPIGSEGQFLGVVGTSPTLQWGTPTFTLLPGSGTTFDTDHVNWGGTLTQNASIDGGAAYAISFDQINSFTGSFTNGIGGTSGFNIGADLYSFGNTSTDGSSAFIQMNGTGIDITSTDGLDANSAFNANPNQAGFIVSDLATSNNVSVQASASSIEFRTTIAATDVTSVQIGQGLILLDAPNDDPLVFQGASGTGISVLGGAGMGGVNGGSITIAPGLASGGGTRGYLKLQNVPTASAGLPSGAVWSNAGVLTLVP